MRITNGNGNKTKLNLGSGIGMGMNYWECEAIGLKKTFPLISNVNQSVKCRIKNDWRDVVRPSAFKTVAMPRISNFSTVSECCCVK